MNFDKTITFAPEETEEFKSIIEMLKSIAEFRNIHEEKKLNFYNGYVNFSYYFYYHIETTIHTKRWKMNLNQLSIDPFGEFFDTPRKREQIEKILSIYEQNSKSFRENMQIFSIHES